MTYSIALGTRARKEFYKLSSDVQAHLAGPINDLQQNPRPQGSKKLSGLEGYRIRTGNYRILYTVDDKAMSIHIYRIGHRRDVYR